MKTHYVYPAVFEYDKPDNIGVYFPDLPGCISGGESTEEAFRMAKEALALHLYGMEQDGDEIPNPSSPKDIELDQDNLVIVMVEVWMVPFREHMDNKAVKKTVTLPKWLNDAAEHQKLNFSRILQNGLKDALEVRNYDKKKAGQG